MMNPVILSRLFATHSGGWKYFARSHLSVATLFFFYVLPMSIIPALMLYYAGTTYRENLLPALTLSASQMQSLSVVFFLVELAMVFVVAWAVQWMANAAFKVLHGRQALLKYPAEEPTPAVPEEVRKVEYHEAFTLAAVAPTPLWLGSLCLFIPSFMVDLTIGTLGLIGAAAIIYYAAPAIFKIEEKGEGILMGYLLIIPGMIAWAAMMYLTLLVWSGITGSAPYL